MTCAEPSPDPAADRPPTLCEVFAVTATDGAATGFVLAQLPRSRGPVLWVQDRVSRREGGRPFAPGLAELLGRPVEILYMEVGRATDVLWAMEQALSCAALSIVIGEVWGDPPALGFTATKRLALRAEARGVAAWLLRRAATPDLSAARERWRVASQPSRPQPHDPYAPGEPLWSAELFRSRAGRTGTWLARREAAGGVLPDPGAVQVEAKGGADRAGALLRLTLPGEEAAPPAPRPAFPPVLRATPRGSAVA